MITVTVTGNLTDDPRSFRTRDGQPGCELRVAADLPPRGSGDGPTRYFKVVTFGVMATCVAASVCKGDRITVQGHDLTSEAWVSDAGEPRSKVAIRATEIAASMRYDTLTTGRAVRAVRAAAPETDSQARAEAAVPAGATTS